MTADNSDSANLPPNADEDWDSCPVCLAHLRRCDGGKTTEMMRAYHEVCKSRRIVTKASPNDGSGTIETVGWGEDRQ